MVSRVWDISSGIGPCFPLAGRLCKFYANAGGKRPIQRQPLLLQHKQEVNPLLSMHNYTPLVISGNDKNKQLTLLSQRKLTFNHKIYVKRLCKFVGTSENIKTRRDASSGLSIYPFMSSKAPPDGS
jgi:hypothetical protein